MKWQPIKSCPAEEYDVLVCWEDGTIEIMPAHVGFDHMIQNDHIMVNLNGLMLTHWMPLPERPSKDD